MTDIERELARQAHLAQKRIRDQQRLDQMAMEQFERRSKNETAQRQASDSPWWDEESIRENTR